jgi:tyrosinase
MRTRFDASTSQGKDMLKIYAGAVGKMMDLNNTDPGNPLSWLFQWYTHGVNQPWQQPTSVSFKQPEIDRIYKNAADPNRALAETMWDTCTPHYGQPSMFFLPWHRMFVYYFEQIIRSISGQDQFTLPYWDYTNSDPARHALPPEFTTMASDPIFKPLFRDQRKAGVNTGDPIDKNRPPFLNLNDMKLATYLPQGPGGFCNSLNANLHGNVHVNVGAQRPAPDLGMTFVPTAANDPIFWLHHCNIDRIWASWNKAGGANPDDQTFKQQPYTFADTGGKQVQRTVDTVLDTQQLEYVYDNYLARPPGSTPFPRPGIAAVARLLLHAQTPPASGPVTLGDRPVFVTLAPQAVPEFAPQGAPGQSGTNARFSAQIATALEKSQIFLVLDGIQAHEVPGVVYDVYVGVPQDKTPEANDPGYVGTLNFFDAHGEHADHGGSGISVAYSAADALRAQQQRGGTELRPTVTLIPQGTLAPGAGPKIGNISLVSEAGPG